MSNTMSNSFNTIVVGGGQAGLAVSHYLAERNVEHAVLEQADRPAEAWRNHRWDSFTLNTPRWQSRLPGLCYGEDDPDGFMPLNEIVAHFERLAQRLPVRYGARVVAIRRDEAADRYVVEIDDSEKLWARNVVVATGLYQTPKVPALGKKFPAEIKQLHSDNYRNPQQLPPGAVLVVGSAQSGAQITEELYESGREVFLAVGSAGRTPRRYRGKDANWWHARLGHYDRTIGELPSPKAKFAGKPHISGTKGGHTLNLHQFARDGVTLLGRLVDIRDGFVKLAGDLHTNLEAADRTEADFVKAVDAYVARTGMRVPEETLPSLRDGFEQSMLTELDLKAAGIANVIWATGYSFDFSMVKLPVTDGDGFPIQTRGVSAYSGLFFVGLPWLSTAKSGLIYGVGEDACYVAERIATRNLRVDEQARPQQRGDLPLESPLPATPAVSSFGSTIRSVARIVLAGALAALSVPSAHGAEAIRAPAPPHVEFVVTPTRQLFLGMTEPDVIRAMGRPAKETDFNSGGTDTHTLEFSRDISSKVVLRDGKVSSVMLEAFRPEKGDLPAFGRKAWPGMTGGAVRRVLGDPTDVLHHTFFGIAVDQWVFSRAGQADVSVFLRADRVIAKAAGRAVPADLFRIDLPSPQGADGEGEIPRLGMKASDIEGRFAATKFRVDYVFNGQPVSRVVFKTESSGLYTSVTFVDDVVTAIEDLGRLLDDPTFQGR